MLKYVVKFTNQKGVKCSATFDKENRALNYLKMLFVVGITTIIIEQFEFEEK